jgi:hypothetical protein
MEMNCPPELLERDFAGKVMVGGLLSLDTIWDPPQKAFACQIDYLKLVVWIVGSLLPWVGFVAVIVSL